MKRSRLLCGLSLAIAACRPSAVQDSPPATSDYELRTDLSHYKARPTQRVYGSYMYAFQVVAHFRNRSNHAVFLSSCYPDSQQPKYDVAVAKTSSSNQESAYSLAWACVGHDRQLAVHPGVERTDTLTLHGPTSWDGRTQQPFGLVEGSFRLIYGVQECRGSTECERAVAPVSSNEFRVTVTR